MPGTDFFQTIMGRKFYEGDVPRIAKALERIAAALEKLAEQGPAPAAPGVPYQQPEQEYRACIRCAQPRPTAGFKLDPFSGEKVCGTCHQELQQKFDALGK